MQPLEYPFVTRAFAPRPFLDHVVGIIESQPEAFGGNPAGLNRKFLKMDNVTPEGDATLFAMKTRLAEHYGLGDYVTPPTLKDFIGFITEGGKVHEHTDPDLPGRRHVRVNVVVRQTEGCMPTLEGVPISVGEGDAWLNLASLCIHGTTPVVGPGYRSAISFGYQVAPAVCDAFYERHRAWMKEARLRAA